MTTINPNEVQWRCRRGMLELDLILQSYLEQRFDALSDDDKHLFMRLLESPDPSLFAWLMGHEQTEDADFARLIEDIRTHS